MYHNMIPANKHLILQRAFSKDLPLLFVPTLAGNFLLLLGMEYLVEAQFDVVLVQDLQVADSAANVKALEMVVTWTQFFALRFVLSAITSPLTSSKVENWAQRILFPLRTCQLTHSYSCHL